MKLKYKTGSVKDESVTSQLKFLTKHNIDTSYMFNVRDSSADIFWTTKYPLFTNDTLNARPMQVRSFDSVGNAEYNWSICYGFIQDFLKDGRLHNDYHTNVDTSLSIASISSLVDDPIMFQKLISDRHGLYIVSFWAKYFGTPGIQTLQEIDNFIDTTNKDVIHIKVNLGKWVD